MTTPIPPEAFEAAKKSVRAGYGVAAEVLTGQIRYAVEAAAPIIRASAELAAGNAVTQREERIQQLEKMAGDMLSRFRDPYGFPIPFCPSLAQYDRWRDVLYGGEQK